LKKQEIGPAIPASRKKTDGLDSSEESFMSYLWVNLITTSWPKPGIMVNV
jgi:hypothetical protein